MNQIILCQDCGQPTVRRCPTTKRCLPCQREADLQRKERWKDSVKKVDRDFGSHYGKMQDCKCPTCKKIHQKKIDWRGRGLPPVYCPAHEKIVDVYGYAQESETKYGIALFLLAILLFSLSACAIAPLKPMDFSNDIRTINVIVGTDGTHSDDTIMGLFDQFNADAITETGIQLNITHIIPFDMSEQKKIWPACQHVIPCWADYVFLNKYQYDIAIFFTRANPIVFILGGVVGEIDDTKLRYIALYNTSYWNFKHHIYHVFHPGHSSSGVMFPLESFSFIPVASSNISEDTRQEILRNKYRPFN